MKALKITLLLLAVVLLTVSGLSTDRISNDDKPTYKEIKSKDLVLIERQKGKIPCNS